MHDKLILLVIIFLLFKQSLEKIKKLIINQIV